MGDIEKNIIIFVFCNFKFDKNNALNIQLKKINNFDLRLGKDNNFGIVECD